MDLLYNKFFTQEQKENIHNIPTAERWMEYKNCEYNVDLWHKFWTEDYKGNKDDTILDFGFGSGWGSIVADTIGFKDIHNLDIDMEDVKRIFGEYHKILNPPNINYWNGHRMDCFESNTFDSIISKASISKNVNSSWYVVLAELVRISKPNATWYIAPHYQVDTLNRTGLTHTLFNKKNIKVVAWEWSGDEDVLKEKGGTAYGPIDWSKK